MSYMVLSNTFKLHSTEHHAKSARYGVVFSETINGLTISRADPFGALVDADFNFFVINL